MYSPKGEYLFTFSASDRPSEQLKVWDVHSYQLVEAHNVMPVARSHVLSRIDMAMNDNPYDRHQRLFLCGGLKMFSVYACQKQQLHAWWPSGHAAGRTSMQYNRRVDRFYSAGVDGVWRVWTYGNNVSPADMPDAMEQDDWDEE